MDDWAPAAPVAQSWVGDVDQEILSLAGWDMDDWIPKAVTGVVALAALILLVLWEE